MRFVEIPKYADPKAAVTRLMQIATAAPRDTQGRVAIARIEKTFRSEGGTTAEYAQAMTTATQEGWLIVDATGKHVTFTGVNRLA
jgi:hypothetical protein